MSDKRHDRSDAFALEAHMLKRFGPDDSAALIQKALAKRQEMERQALAPAAGRSHPEATTPRFQTSNKAAAAAGKTLQHPAASKAEKAAAASALTQHKSAKEQTSQKAASQAGKVLQNPKSSPAAKSAAASALTQAADKKPAAKKKR